MKKIKLEGKCNLPSIAKYNNMYQVNYGANRGWRAFTVEQLAIDEMNDHLDMRIHSAARDLAELCKLQRKYRNG
jgi:hypothetical protein